MREQFVFPDIDSMPDIPQLPIPDYESLNKSFKEALLDPANEIYRLDVNGHPNFGAYIGSPSNEFVTWGILVLGEWLLGGNIDWISGAFRDFYSGEHQIFLNSPNNHRSEYWYLFYVNSLAGAVSKHAIGGSGGAMDLVRKSAESMLRMALSVDYDFNEQGYDFGSSAPWTRKDIYRQPDSLAGFAYNMLFAALHCGDSELLAHCIKAMALYARFDNNPWYEIPNGSAGLYAAAWLNAHGRPQDMKKIAGWIYDHVEGPLQTGQWGNEDINGLFMGWRGDNRQYALDAAYSMESLMPIQFLLPSVKYCPELALSVAKHMRNLLSSFQLFFAKGTEQLYESKPDLCRDVPYEKLERERDGRSPAACGDFYGHRSVYGAGYMYWVEALARKTGENMIPAMDLSLTDWLSEKRYPLFLLDNPNRRLAAVKFTPAPAWKLIAPDIFANGGLNAVLWDLDSTKCIGFAQDCVTYELAPKERVRLALLPRNRAPVNEDDTLKLDGVEIGYI